MRAKITAAAQKAIESGIKSHIIRRSSGGNICQEGFCECENGRILEVYWDLSEPLDNQITNAKVVRMSWHEAMMDAVNS